MILVTERDALASALSRVASIVDSKQTIPILGNVMLTAVGDTLTVRATNLDMEAIEMIPAVVGVEGETTISALKLNEVVASLHQGSQIAFKLEGLRMSITSGRSRFTLGCLSVSGFPQLWEEAWSSSFEIEADQLAGLLARVDFAQAKLATRLMLLGVRIHNEGQRVRFAATDGFLCSYVDGPEVGEFIPTTIPTKMVAQMKALAQALTGTVVIGISDGKIMMRGGETTLTSKVIDRGLGYPLYMRVFPDDLPNVAGMTSSDVAAALRRAMVASQNGKDISVKFRFAGDGLAVTGQNSEADALDEIGIAYEGPDETISLHPTMMLSLLASMPGELLEVRFSKQITAWRTQGDDSGRVALSTQRMGGA